MNLLATRWSDKETVEETSLPAIPAQIKALTRWGTDPVTVNLTKIDNLF